MKIILIFIVTVGPYVFIYVHRLGSKFRIWIRKLFMERSDSKYFRVCGLYGMLERVMSPCKVHLLIPGNGEYVVT